MALTGVAGMFTTYSQGEARAFADVGSARRCDLIAMTTHGAAGLHRWAVGSITERVLRATTLPLLIVRPADMIERDRRRQEI